MAIIVKSDLETAKQYKNKNVTTKIGTKKHQVFFKVAVDDFSFIEGVELAKSDKNILMLDYVGSESYLRSATVPTDSSVYIGVSRVVGNNLVEEDILNILSDIPEGVTPIIKVPDDYKNIEFLYSMSQKYDRIRFCGGYMFCFEGCKLGCCGRDILDKANIKYNETDYIKEGCSCALEVVSGEGLELVVTAKAERTSNTSTKATTSKKPKPMLFSDLLYSGGKVSL